MNLLCKSLPGPVGNGAAVGNPSCRMAGSRSADADAKLDMVGSLGHSQLKTGVAVAVAVRSDAAEDRRSLKMSHPGLKGTLRPVTATVSSLPFAATLPAYKNRKTIPIKQRMTQILKLPFFIRTPPSPH
jgi:hypothetical protein